MELDVGGRWSSCRSMDPGFEVGAGSLGAAGALVGLPLAWRTWRSCVSMADKLDFRLDPFVSIELKLVARACFGDCCSSISMVADLERGLGGR